MSEYPNQNDQYIDEMPEPNDSELRKIVAMANEYVELAWELERTRAKLAALEKQYMDLGNVMLPDAMKQVGLSQFRLENGYNLKVRPVLGCSVLKENIDKAEQWLEDNGHSGLVKHQLQVDIRAKHDPMSRMALEQAIAALGYNCEDVKRIHPQTLLKWAREMQEANDVIPSDIFNVYHGYKTEINK